MKIECVWEHNGNDSILYARDYPGAFTRGQSLEHARIKMNREIVSYFNWVEAPNEASCDIEIIQEKSSDLNIKDADSDVIFDSERAELSFGEYEALKALALKSAADFQALYDSIPDKNAACLPARKTFYGDVPRTAEQMYQHTKNVNAYYFGEIGIDADNEGTIVTCRENGFELLERIPDFLTWPAVMGSYGEEWSLRKLLRRFIWHDRIHGKAMYRMAGKTFSGIEIANVFKFEL